MMGYKVDGQCVCRNSNGDVILSAEVRVISPDDAKEMLAHNVGNRKIKDLKVRLFAKEMEDGNWKINGESICISTNGELKDGQHRLQAIVRSGVTLPLVVVTVPNVQAKLYDSGTVRSIGDHINFSGDPELMEMKDKAITAATVFLNSLSKVTQDEKRIISHVETMDSIKKHISTWAWLKGETAYSSIRGKKGIGQCAVFAAIVAAYEAGYPEQKLLHFMEILSSGIISTPDDAPIIKLRDYLLVNATSQHRSDQLDTFMRTQYALNAYEHDNKRALCRNSGKIYYEWKK